MHKKKTMSTTNTNSCNHNTNKMQKKDHTNTQNNCNWQNNIYLNTKIKYSHNALSKTFLQIIQDVTRTNTLLAKNIINNSLS